MTLRSGLKAVVIVGLTVAAAYVLGSQSGNLLGRKKQRDARVVRTLQTQELVKYMGTIRVGDTLPDYIFQGLDGKAYRLSGLVCKRTLLSVFDYHCDNCLMEIEEIKEAVHDSSEAKHIILISGSNPLQLIGLRDAYKIPFTILYDEDRRFLSNYNIMTSPFNIVVNQSMQIEEITAGALLREEIEQLWKDHH